MLQFKINLEGLIWKNDTVEKWTKEDVHHIITTAHKNGLTWRINYEGHRVIEGKHENLYAFLFDVAYRYDIELI